MNFLEFRDLKRATKQNRLFEGIVYHGSPVKFSKFSQDQKNKKSNRTDLYGPGFYFTSNLNVAQEYGKYIYEAKIYMAKPIVLESQFSFFTITQAQMVKLLKKYCKLVPDRDENNLNNWYEYYENGPTKEILNKIAKELNNTLSSFIYDVVGADNDLMAREIIRDELGYDGVIKINTKDNIFFIPWFEDAISDVKLLD